VFLPINQGASNGTYPFMAVRCTSYDHHHPAFARGHLEFNRDTLAGVLPINPEASNETYSLMALGVPISVIIL
jgi:hypothetical protein